MKKKKRLISIILAGLMMSSAMSACSDGSADSQSINTSSKETSSISELKSEPADIDTQSEKLTTITLYPYDANLTSGVVGGWRGDFFATKGLQIEVWAYSDEKTNAILASGDLPDIMYMNEDNYETMIQGNMLLNLDEHMDKMPNVSAYEPMETALEYIRQYRSAGTGEVYFMPRSVGVNSVTDDTERNALRLNLPYYESIGAPEFSDMWDLIPIVKQMLEANPADEEGNKNFGTVLNSGSDTSYWGNALMPYLWNGYGEKQLPYLIESDMVNEEMRSILESDSKYHEIMKWYNALYREGLVDEDSINLDRPTQKAKVDGGNVMMPSGTNPGWPPYYYQYYLKDTNIYYPNYNTYGSPGIGIHSNSPNIDASLAFLNMLASPDDFMAVRSCVEGVAWTLDGNTAMPTEGLLDSIRYPDPEHELKGPDGSVLDLWNTSFICGLGAPTTYVDGEGKPRTPDAWTWKESLEILRNTDTMKQWQETTGHESWVEWLESENALYRTSKFMDIESFASLPSDSQQLTVDALRDIVVNSSWQLVYAAGEQEFDSIWDKMVSDCEGLGSQEIIDWRMKDLEEAQKIKDSLGE